jgi:hypothetical protein
MKKLKALKVAKRRKKEKKHVLWVGKLIFLLVIYLLFLFICTSKMTSRAWDKAPIAF